MTGRNGRNVDPHAMAEGHTPGPEVFTSFGRSVTLRVADVVVDSYAEQFVPQPDHTVLNGSRSEVISIFLAPSSVGVLMRIVSDVNT